MDALKPFAALLAVALLCGCGAARARVNVQPKDCSVADVADCTIDDSARIKCAAVKLSCNGYEVKK